MNTLSHRGISLITNAANANWLRDPKEIEIQEGKLMEYVFFLEARVAGLEALLEKFADVSLDLIDVLPSNFSNREILPVWKLAHKCYEITNSKKKNEIRLKE